MTLVGRDAELIVLERELRRARDRHGAFVLLSGEMGIGKTRLADEIARRAGGELLVAWGRSWEGEGTPAYWPFLQLLRVLRSETPAVRFCGGCETPSITLSLMVLLQPFRGGGVSHRR